MSDWILDEQQKIPNEVPTSNRSNEWEVENQPLPSQESFSESLVKSPLRIGEDIVNKAINIVGKAPEYYEKAKTEIPGAFNVLRKHPLHALGQIGAGSQELINQLAQLPKNISEYGTNRLNLVPQGLTNMISKITPEDTTQAINELFGKPKYEGEELLRGIPRNLPAIIGTGATASYLNPARYSYKNISKNVVNVGEKMRLKYNEKYNNLFKEAKNKGIKEIPIEPEKIDIQSLALHSNPKYLYKTLDLLENPTVENAHWARSDLGKLINAMDKPTLSSTEQSTLNAAKSAKKYIEDNMFMDKSGKINQDLLDKYKTITSGYEKERIPYSTNKAIKSYKKGELSSKELVPKLSKGKFAARRGKYHPEISRREIINKLLPKLGIAGGLIYGGKTLYDYMTGNK